MPDIDIRARTGDVVAAWNRQNVDELLAHYTEDCVYLDPSTRGPLQGHAAFGQYLERLFSKWWMKWTVLEQHPFARDLGADEAGGVFILRAEVVPIGVERAHAR